MEHANRFQIDLVESANRFRINLVEFANVFKKHLVEYANTFKTHLVEYENVLKIYVVDSAGMAEDIDELLDEETRSTLVGLWLQLVEMRRWGTSPLLCLYQERNIQRCTGCITTFLVQFITPFVERVAI